MQRVLDAVDENSDEDGAEFSGTLLGFDDYVST